MDSVSNQKLDPGDILTKLSKIVALKTAGQLKSSDLYNIFQLKEACDLYPYDKENQYGADGSKFICEASVIVCYLIIYISEFRPCNKEEAEIINTLEEIIFGPNCNKTIKKMRAEKNSSICGVRFEDEDKLYTCEQGRLNLTPSCDEARPPSLCVNCYIKPLSPRSHKYKKVEYGMQEGESSGHQFKIISSFLNFR